MSLAPSIFRGDILGGFECSSHRPKHGARLDLIAATQHDRFVYEDYARAQAVGIRTVRDGIRWHLIERAPGEYDFSSVLPMVRAARATGTQVIWDLCHYGWPDDLDLFSPEFVTRLGRFAGAFARLLRDEGDAAPLLSPVNEISFFAWASGEVGYFFPYAEGRGDAVKRQLVRAALAASDAAWAVNPATRIVHTDPIINVVADPAHPEHREPAEAYRLSQFEAWDMIAGQTAPELGGHTRYLDIIGVNFYPHNQWRFSNLPFHPSFALHRDDPQYRPLRLMLRETYQRYKRPLFIAETGADGDARAAWLAMVGAEVQAARAMGVPVEGICLYPAVNFPWWDDGVLLHNGLWDVANETGERATYAPLADELVRQQRALATDTLPPLTAEADAIGGSRSPTSVAVAATDKGAPDGASLAATSGGS